MINSLFSLFLNTFRAFHLLANVYPDTSEKLHTYFEISICCQKLMYNSYLNFRKLQRGGPMKELFMDEEPPEQDINDVVDADDRRIEHYVSEDLVGAVVDGGYFKAFIFFLIVVNSILIALQTDEVVVRFLNVQSRGLQFNLKSYSQNNIFRAHLKELSFRKFVPGLCVAGPLK